MTITKTLDPALTAEHGRPCYNYATDAPEGWGLLVTGPISGTVALKDGTVYNVSDDIIETAPGHNGPVAHHIAVMHERSGAIDPDFRHVCTDLCGDEAATGATPTAAASQ